MPRKGRIFVSYASDRQADAEPIALALRSRGYDVFFDRDDLPAGQTYHDQIAAAIGASDILVFLVSPESVDKGRYTVTEIGIARKKWRTPKGRILPVMLAPTPIETIPAYLREVSFFETDGNLVADAALEVDQMFAALRREAAQKSVRTALRFGAVALGLAALAAGWILAGDSVRSWFGQPSTGIKLAGQQIARSPSLGVQIFQNGEAVTLYDQKDPAGPFKMGRIAFVLDRAPFEVRIPRSAWSQNAEPELDITVLDDASLFDQVKLDVDRSEIPFLIPGTGTADNEFGSGTIWSTHFEYEDCCPSHNVFFGNRFNASDGNYLGFLVSDLHNRLTKENMIDVNAQAYLVMYLDRDGGAWDQPDPVRFNEIEGFEITFRD